MYQPMPPRRVPTVMPTMTKEQMLDYLVNNQAKLTNAVQNFQTTQGLAGRVNTRVTTVENNINNITTTVNNVSSTVNSNTTNIRANASKIGDNRAYATSVNNRVSGVFNRVTNVETKLSKLDDYVRSVFNQMEVSLVNMTRIIMWKMILAFVKTPDMTTERYVVRNSDMYKYLQEYKGWLAAIRTKIIQGK